MVACCEIVDNALFWKIDLPMINRSSMLKQEWCANSMDYCQKCSYIIQNELMV